MKRLILLAVLGIFTGGVVFAQDDYKKAEVFVGYSAGQIDRGSDSDIAVAPLFFDLEKDNKPYHGVNVSGVYNVSRHVGLKADFSVTFNRTDFSFQAPGGSFFAFETQNALYNFLGGIQIKNNGSRARFKPFVHAMAGVGRGRTNVKAFTCPAGVDCSNFAGGSETGLAGAFGGGLDIKLTNHVDFRLIQVDYNPIKFEGGVQQNARFGIGFVFR